MFRTSEPQEKPKGRGSILQVVRLLDFDDAILVAIFLIAPVLALMTWQADYSRSAIRDMSWPVVCAEFIIVLALLMRGSATGGISRAMANRTILLACAWLISACTSTFLAQNDPQAARYHMLITLLHVVFGFLMWNVFVCKPALRAKALIALAWSLGTFGVVIVVCAATVFTKPNFDWLSFGAGVTNIRQIAFFGLALAGVAGGLTVFARSARSKTQYSVLLGIGIFLVLWSGGRAGAGALLVQMALILFCIDRSERLKFAKVLVIMFLLASLAADLFSPSPIYGPSRILGRAAPDASASIDSYTTGRAVIWKETIEAIAQKPWFGYGEAQFKTAIASAQSHYNHPHMLPLQILFQWGLVGSVLFCAYIGSMARGAQKAFGKDGAVLLPSFSVLSGLVTMSLLEGPYFWPYPVMISAVSLAIISASPALTPRSTNNPVVPKTMQHI